VFAQCPFRVEAESETAHPAQTGLPELHALGTAPRRVDDDGAAGARRVAAIPSARPGSRTAAERADVERRPPNGPATAIARFLEPLRSSLGWQRLEALGRALFHNPAVSEKTSIEGWGPSVECFRDTIWA
jgi:hypothetical protein